MKTKHANLFLIAALSFSAVYVIMNAAPLYGINGQKPVITADRIEFRKKDNVTIFSGNVKALYEKYRLTADFIKKDDLNEIIHASGNVKTRYNTAEGEEINSTSGFARYTSSDKETLLWGKPYLVYKTTAAELHIFSEKMLFGENTRKIDFEENVVIKQEGNTAESPFATYFHETQKLYLYTREDSPEKPSIEYSKDQNIKFLAREITMFFNDKKFIFEREVDGKISR